MNKDFKKLKDKFLNKKVSLIVGLGNPGEEYKETRHNIGFKVLNLFAKKYEKKFKRKFQSRIFDIVYDGHRFFFQKPMTYMNLSGNAVKKVCELEKLSNSQVVVIYDDVYLPLGEMRICLNGGSGGHNGVKDMINKLEGNDFIRLRLGIGPFLEKTSLEDYVLDFFSKKEIPLVKEVCNAALEVVLMLFNKDCEAVMNLVNGKVIKFD